MKTFSFIKNQKIFFGIAVVVFIIGIVSFFINGFNVDIDFVGGTEISYDINKTVTKEDEAAIEAAVIEAVGAENFSSLRVSGETVIVRTLVVDNQENTDVVSAAINEKMAALYPDAALDAASTETDKTFTLASAEWTDEQVSAIEAELEAIGADGLNVNADGANLSVSFTASSPVAKLRSDITEAVTLLYEEAEWLSTDSVSAEISAGLRNSAIIATSVAVVLMLVYIAFRFQISSAFAAIVCLIHDLFVTLVAYSLFQIPVNSTIIAVLLTILGYSINATIIIFDRIRENDKKFTDGEGFSVKVDDGIRNTLLRSVNTTITTLFTIGMIYLLGVTSIKNFALPLIVGIVAGLFSSVCLAGPLWRLFKKLGRKIRNK